MDFDISSRIETKSHLMQLNLLTGEHVTNGIPAYTKMSLKWSLEAIKGLRNALGNVLQSAQHADNCPAKEEMPRHIIESGVQIGGSGRSLEADEWEKKHPCNCGLDEYWKLHQAFSELDN